MNTASNTDCRAALDRLMHEFAAAQTDGEPIFHQRLAGLPDQALSEKTWQDFRLANYLSAGRLNPGEWDRWIPHADGTACNRFVGTGDKAKLDLFQRLADTGVALLKAGALAQQPPWQVDSSIREKIESSPAHETYLLWLDALHLTAKQCRTLFLHVTVGNWAHMPRGQESVEEVATAISEPTAFGLAAFPIHPILESLQHDVFRSSVEAIKVWLGAEDVVRVGDWPKRPPIFLPPLPQSDQQVAEADEGRTVPADVASNELGQGTVATPTQTKLVVDRETFSASYQGKTCALGNTKPFEVLERLNQRPGIYVSVTSLIDDVWRDENTEIAAVQKIVSNLRGELEKVFGTAVKIEPQKDHYRLVLS